MQETSLRNYAHLGDAVWELYVREFTVFQTQDSKTLHEITTERVNAKFQCDLLEKIMPELNSDEQEIIRRARNIPVPVARRSNQAEYRMATAFEALIGHLYINDKPRLQALFTRMLDSIINN